MERKSVYDVLEGACFGNHDANFDECRRCKAAKACLSATSSSDDVRSVPKTSTEVIEALVKKYSENEIQ